MASAFSTLFDVVNGLSYEPFQEYSLTQNTLPTIEDAIEVVAGKKVRRDGDGFVDIPQGTANQSETSYKVGDYVQNPGPFQFWTGRIIQIDNGTYRVRITYVSDNAFNRSNFSVTDEPSLLEEEFQRMTGTSIDAMLKGFK